VGHRRPEPSAVAYSEVEEGSSAAPRTIAGSSVMVVEDAGCLPPKLLKMEIRGLH